jgi:hypothetical protein
MRKNGSEANSASFYNAIEQRYKFIMPFEYKTMQQRGWFDTSKIIRKPFHLVDVVEKSGYLFVGDLEWYSLQQIAEFEFADYQYDHYVPFAHTGSGDYFAWSLKQIDNYKAPVVELPHDIEIADIHSPNLAGCIYLEILRFCTYLRPEKNQSLKDAERDARRCIQHWCKILNEFFPTVWIEHLGEIEASPFIHFQDYGMLIDFKKLEHLQFTDLGLRRKNKATEFRWMKPN